jgi:diguanylate cyclase (GGDEF)-like protein
MKANTALAILLYGLGLSLATPKQSSRILLVSRIVAASVILIAALTLAEYIFHIFLGLDTLLSPDSATLRHGRMSPQTATSLLLMGVILIFFRIRKGVSAWVVDLILSCLCVLLLIMASGYMFDAMHLFGLSPSTRTAPQTLACLMLLTFVVFDRRAEYGIFAIILGTGIGSRITRIACPIVLILPFLLEIGRAGIIHSQRVSPDYATAQATALIAMCAFGLVLIMAWRIDGMEREIRDLSLRDELTKLYNRRGFYVLAEQALNLAQRSRMQFSVLFIDLNNLKQINDTLGHGTGSAFLLEVADLVRRSFRDTDVIGRIGGDEIVVAGESTETGINIAAMRLEQATVHRNAQGGHRYPLSISIGCATSDVDKPRSLEELLNKADKAMYKEKQLSKQLVSSR